MRDTHFDDVKYLAHGGGLAISTKEGGRLHRACHGGDPWTSSFSVKATRPIKDKRSGLRVAARYIKNASNFSAMVAMSCLTSFLS